MKKIAVIMLSLLMSTSIVACGSGKEKTEKPAKDSVVSGDKSNEETNDGALDFSEKVDINITAWYPKTLSNNDKIIEFLEDKFNVNIKYELLPDSEYDNTISMRVAADDIPTYMRLKQAPVYSGLHQDGYIANISEYADKYGFENLKQYLSDPALEIDKEADGFYKIPGKIGPALHGMYIRQDWLDKLGLEIPKTYDDLYTVLTAFKENKLDGQDVSPLTMNGLFFLRRSSVAFTGVNEWGKVDGKWTSEQMVPGYKDFLKTMNKFYKEGLLDREIFTLNRSQAFEKIALGKAGMTYSNDGFFHDLQGQLTDINPDGKLTPIVPWMEGPKGSLRPMGTGYYGYGVLSEKAPEETKVRMLAILDYLTTDEGSELVWDGIEGVHFEVVDGKKVYNQEARERDFLGDQHHRLAQFVDYSFGYTLLEDEGLIANAEDALKDENSVIDYTANFTSPEAQQIKPIIDDIANRWAVNFITGDADIDADWDKYTAEMEKAGYNIYIDELTKYMESIGR